MEYLIWNTHGILNMEYSWSTKYEILMVAIESFTEIFCKQVVIKICARFTFQGVIFHAIIILDIYIMHHDCGKQL